MGGWNWTHSASARAAPARARSDARTPSAAARCCAGDGQLSEAVGAREKARGVRDEHDGNVDGRVGVVGCFAFCGNSCIQAYMSVVLEGAGLSEFLYESYLRKFGLLTLSER